MSNPNGERIAAMETELVNQGNKLNDVENSIKELHGKFDTFQNTIITGYVAKETFEEYKRARWLERVLIALVTSAITGLISFFLVNSKFI